MVIPYAVIPPALIFAEIGVRARSKKLECGSSTRNIPESPQNKGPYLFQSGRIVLLDDGQHAGKGFHRILQGGYIEEVARTGGP